MIPHKYINTWVHSYVKWLYTGTILCNFLEGSFLFCKLKSGSHYVFQNSYAMLQSHNNYSSNKSHISQILVLLA
jgi:hypothetical protein